MSRTGRYSIRRIYVIICQDCNEDISRPITGEDIDTRAEADEAMADHDRIFHGQS